MTPDNSSGRMDARQKVPIVISIDGSSNRTETCPVGSSAVSEPVCSSASRIWTVFFMS